MAITTYSTLATAINEWSDRSYSAAKLLEFVGLAEAKFNLIPGFRSYRRETTEGTLTTDSSGEVSLPSGFIRMRSIVRDYSGSTPLTPVSWAELKALNQTGASGIPTHYAISGTTLRVADVCEDDFLATYESSLSSLSTSNETNWLITLAPHAYLHMCLAVAETYEHNFDTAAAWAAQAAADIAEIGVQSDLAQYSDTQVELDTVIP